MFLRYWTHPFTLFPCQHTENHTSIFQMAGVDVPQVTYRQAYVVTEPLEGARQLPNVRQHDESFYIKRQGDSLQIGGYEFNPIFCEKVSLLKLCFHQLYLLIYFYFRKFSIFGGLSILGYIVCRNVKVLPLFVAKILCQNI